MTKRKSPGRSGRTDRQIWERLEAELRKRDHDPAYADAPVLDAYARLSHNPDTGDTEKVDRQLVDILGNITRRFARLGAVLSDDNKSAWRLDRKRPDWDKLMERLQAKQSQGVVAWHTDRLMRQPYDLEILIKLAEDDWIVGSCHGDRDISDPDERFILRILVAAACKASDDTSRRRKRAVKAWREQGYMLPVGKVFGWQKDGSLHPEEAAALRWGVEQILRGVSLRSIAREWEARGLGSFRGTSIRQIMLRPRNAALIVDDGHVLRQAVNVEPIISWSQWQDVAAVFAARRRGRPSTSQRYLLTGHLHCANCSHRMNGTQNAASKTSRYPAYRCSGCRKITIRADAAEAWVRDQVIKRLSDPAHARAIEARSTALADVEARLNQLRETQVRLADRLGRGEISEEAFDAYLRQQSVRRVGLEQERDRLTDVGTTGVALSMDIASDWDSGDNERRKALIRAAAPHGFAVEPSGPGGWTPAERRMKGLRGPLSPENRPAEETIGSEIAA